MRMYHTRLEDGIADAEDLGDAGEDPIDQASVFGRHCSIERWRRRASARTRQVIASATGTTRGQRQGSCRPVIAKSRSWPAVSTVFWVIAVEEGGFTGMRITIRSPVEIPPS